jgi:hypothetical protein
MRLSWKSLRLLAVLYTLITWANNKTTATGEAQKMIFGYRGYEVTNIV